MVAKGRFIASLGEIIIGFIGIQNGRKKANCFRHLSFYFSSIPTFGASRT
jgi:hypothetical protein